YVATTSSGGGNGSASSPFHTISEAIAANLRPGDEVVVKPGTYNESINIDKDGSAAGDITLRSEVPGVDTDPGVRARGRPDQSCAG
ncbi:DUF1565 domain-containing protein, partial [Rhizobium ruizarguesonis]